MDAVAVELRAAIANDTRMGKAYLSLARLHQNQNQWSDCVRIFEQGLEATTSDTEALAFELGRARLLCPDKKLYSVARAGNLARRATEADPTSGRAWVLLGLVQFMQRKNTEALESGQRAEAEGGDLANALWIRALASHALGKAEKARELHARATGSAQGTRDTPLRAIIRALAMERLAR